MENCDSTISVLDQQFSTSSMETEELIKLVDGIYKNILDKFNPGARQMINAGKAYLKALHGAAAASRLYVDAITKLARQAQQGTWGGSSDIGSALMKIVEVYKEIQEQQMNILKAFYVDLLVPLETNLEKDTKVVQSEQKKFLQQHKQRSETYSKAAAMMKKQRKKSRGSTKAGIAMDKELKNMQVLEEEKTKLDAFCEQSLKTAMTQERRRYGFVLERQCSLAKHYLSYHSQGVTVYQQNIDEWSEVAKTREFLPEAVESMFTNRMRQVSFWPDEDVYSNPRSPQLDDDRLSITSQLRKTKSMDASCLDIRSIGDASSPMLSLSRAKSDFNLTASTHSLVQDCSSPVRRPKSMALPSSQPPQWDIQLARSLYAYLSSGENQLSFLEGDVIALMGDRNKGWQFGENLRTQCSGWFPLAYTEILDDPTISPSHRLDASGSSGGHMSSITPTNTGTLMSPGPAGVGMHSGSVAPVDHPTPRMFGDTLHLHRSSANAKQIRRVTGSNNYVPPPALPAPVPTPTLPFAKTSLTQSQSTTFSSPSYPSTSPFPPAQYSQPGGLKTSASSFNFTTNQTSGYSTHPQGVRAERPPPMPPLPLHLQTKGGKIGGAVGNVSLHSSNDSGFSNDPPPQPEVDYSDDESSHTISKVPIRKSQRNKNKNDDNNNSRNTLPMRPSNSSGNLVESRSYLTNDQQAALRSIHMTNSEKKGLIKRTKSFWRFGKHNADSEILEGMSMWKHRDLVDVNENPIAPIVNNNSKQNEKPTENNTAPANNRSGSEKSNDSDKTLNAKQVEENSEEIYGTTSEVPLQKRSTSFSSKQKLSLPARKDAETGHDIDFENHFQPLRHKATINNNNNDQFYDDEGDGLMLRTVNRKDILKQYSNDSTASDESDSESEITSDDPYDCIVVDDHTQQKSKRNPAAREREKFPNVAEIGKKLEQFSKSNKFSPDTKENHHLSKEQFRNSMNNKINKMNARNSEKNIDVIMNSEPEHQEILTYRNSRGSQPLRSPTPEPRHSFKTFGIEGNEQVESKVEKQRISNENNKQNATPQPEVRRKTRHYSENDRDVSPMERRSKYTNTENHNHEKSNTVESSKRERRSNMENRNRVHSESERHESMKYYPERQDVVEEPKYSDGHENRQFLPRTKLVKSNSIGATMQTVMKFEHEIVEYGDGNVKHKKAEYGAKYEDLSPNNGNIYGPWYDLWGLDATTQK